VNQHQPSGPPVQPEDAASPAPPNPVSTAPPSKAAAFRESGVPPAGRCEILRASIGVMTGISAATSLAPASMPPAPAPRIAMRVMVMSAVSW